MSSYYNKHMSPIADLQRALRTDEDYRQAWVANIAMAFYDAVHQYPDKTVQEVANIAAEQFITNLCRQ